MSQQNAYQAPKKRGVVEGLFCKHVRLSWLWRSECHVCCWAQFSWVFFVFLGVTLDCAETRFAKNPLSWLLKINNIFLGVSQDFLGILFMCFSSSPQENEPKITCKLGSRFLSSADVGKSCVLPVLVPNPSPTLDKNLASMGPGILSSIGVGVWKKDPEALFRLQH